MKKVAHQFFEDDGLDYEDILYNFDDFCDQFEKRASESYNGCLLYTSPSPRDGLLSRMPSSA